jgi:hypothetical protein
LQQAEREGFWASPFASFKLFTVLWFDAAGSYSCLGPLARRGPLRPVPLVALSVGLISHARGLSCNHLLQQLASSFEFCASPDNSTATAGCAICESTLLSNIARRFARPNKYVYKPYIFEFGKGQRFQEHSVWYLHEGSRLGLLGSSGAESSAKNKAGEETLEEGTPNPD